MRLAAHPNDLFPEKLLGRHLILGSQIEDSAHHLEKKDSLIARARALQRGHWRLQHLFDDAMTQRIDSVLLVRAQIAHASAHTLHCIAAHALKTLA